MKRKVIAFVVLLSTLLIPIIVAYASINANSNSNENATSVNTQIPQFKDVKEDDWYYEDVKYINEKRLMKGTSSDCFSHAEITTRGMIVTILWRLEGEPVENGKIFEDVMENAYYHNAVEWASNNGIVSGYSETIFGPEDYATREQLAVIMYRYAIFKKYDTSKLVELKKYSDKEQISEYAVKSLQWANANSIISGISEDLIAPKENAQRCQVAAILKRFCENYKLFNEKNVEEKEHENNDTFSADTEEIIRDGGGSDESQTASGDIQDIDVETQIPLLKVNTTYGKPNGYIRVVVDVKNNPGILGMVLQLEYEEEIMSLINAENGEAVSNILTLTTSKELKSGVKFVWDGLNIESGQIKNGSVLVLDFKLSKDVSPGKRYPLSFNYNPGDIVDSNLNSINLKISQGFVVIK